MPFNNSLPKDKYLMPVYLVPDVPSLKSTYNPSVSTALDIVLAGTTTTVIVDSMGQGSFVRFASVASSANYDRFVPAGGTLMIPLPAKTSVISIIQEQANARVSVVEI